MGPMRSGWIFTKLLQKFVKISVTLGLNILSFLTQKVIFLKQIPLEFDITYVISSKIPILYVKLVLKSRLKL